MKFYYTKGACSLAVRIVLNELNCKYEAIAVDLKTKKTETGEDFLTINPKGAVPALGLDNGNILTENQAILQYLADNTQNQQLLAPVGEMLRYHTLEWLNFVATEIHKSFSLLFYPSATSEIKSDFIMPIIHHKLKFLNQHLDKHTYLMGASFTLPDAYLFVILRWSNSLNIDLKSYNNIQQFMEHIQEKSSVCEALKQENL